MGNSVPVPERPPVPEGKTRICVAGFGISNNVGYAQMLASAIAEKFPDKYETWFYFSNFGYREFLKDFQANHLPDDYKDKPCSMDKNSKTFATQTAAPLVFFQSADGTIVPKGGRDLFCQWAAEEFKDHPDIVDKADVATPPMKYSFFDHKTPGGTYLNNK
eukprot:CAMPEP_0197433230 /NCGR_PEP_ID=MMETSP1175-20131217/1161_1 /TAXON_ID=1003142 /ORGANISM="Triceratium dubium, Strain CCMP147" /LENGTH=160 /DNA_ID=CAMNT_0042961549 /DNA_START=35 /DNA_END=517 /DNA_ORIENTATION=+